MDETIEVNVDDTIAEGIRKQGKRNVKGGTAKKHTKKQARTKKEKKAAQAQAEEVAGGGERLPSAAEHPDEGPPGGITVSVFDYSVENHFKAVDMISNLCGEADSEFDPTEISRLSSSVTFLREWRHFNYQSRIIRFACQSESPEGKDIIGGINLPQFSAAAVPKMDSQNGTAISSESSKDFVMYVGGSVWALDWCPRVHQRSDCDIKSEFIAVAAHPPESSYHKIGAPLAGRGIIQIWSILNVCPKEEDVPLQVRKKPKQNPSNRENLKVKSTQPKKPRGRPRKNPINKSVDNLDCNYQHVPALAVQFLEEPSKLLPTAGVSRDTHEKNSKKDSGRKRKGSSQQVSVEPRQNPDNSLTIMVKSTQLKKPRGRPRKKAINESGDNLDCNDQQVQALAVGFLKDSSKLITTNGVSGATHEQVATRYSGRKQKGSSQGVSENSAMTASLPRRLKDKARTRGHFDGNGLPLITLNENDESSLENPKMSSRHEQDPVGSSKNVANNGSIKTNHARNSIPKDVALPRVVLCLAHNGKVAWDVKWQPSVVCATESKHRMGYLAVLLGNGALEVWEVPFPRAIKAIYSACEEGTDPRFLKLEPVFRCSMLKCDDRQSIPLTVEWSASSPHDLILAGCHDGVVALWKFSANGSSKDTRPLLCFSADTVPIRALAWAAVESDPESANVFVTAGHRGLKFWDLRDPFHPLWELNPVQSVVCSLDWLPDPRCVIISYDDGTLRILSLLKAAHDVPVTGKPFVGTQQQGLHNYLCSPFAIWSVQVSRLTGMVAYCSADGTVLHFQLTTKEVEKDNLRNRAPHFLCGSLTEEESALTVVTPLPGIPFPMKKSLNEWGNTPRTKRGFLSVSNQEKRAKEKIAKCRTSDEQPLALCYGDDPGIEFGSDDTLVAQKGIQAPKSTISRKKKLIADQTLECRYDDQENVQREDGEKGEIGNEIEVFPPKIVAMHRVRWNMNKGSERLLCYGGAGGILCCRKIGVFGS